jgi:hypothetical protein
MARWATGLEVRGTGTGICAEKREQRRKGQPHKGFVKMTLVSVLGRLSDDDGQVVEKKGKVVVKGVS